MVCWNFSLSASHISFTSLQFHVFEFDLFLLSWARGWARGFILIFYLNLWPSGEKKHVNMYDVAGSRFVSDQFLEFCNIKCYDTFNETLLKVTAHTAAQLQQHAPAHYYSIAIQIHGLPLGAAKITGAPVDFYVGFEPWRASVPGRRCLWELKEEEKEKKNRGGGGGSKSKCRPSMIWFN